MMAATETYTPRLKEQYENEIRPRLKDELGLSSIMQVPRIEKITLNMGVGEAKNDAKQLHEDNCCEEGAAGHHQENISPNATRQASEDRGPTRGNPKSHRLGCEHQREK